MRRLRRGLAAVAGLALLAVPALAHDFWIEPSEFHPASGELVRVHLRVGEEFHGEVVPRRASLFTRFAVVQGEGEQPILGLAGSDPAGVLRPAAAGPAWLLYESTESRVTLAAEPFEAYLREEGLEAIVALRGEGGESTEPGREAFSRGAKTLLCVSGNEVPADSRGPESEVPADSQGLAIELVPEADLCAVRGAGEVPFRLEFQGRPVAGALVAAFRREPPEERLEARTDAAGRVHLDLAGPGVWLVKAVHMVRAPDGTEVGGAAVDWRSYWASLTFELLPGDQK